MSELRHIDKELMINLAKAGIRPKVLAKFFGHSAATISTMLSQARQQGHDIAKFVNGSGGVSEQALLLFLDGLTPASIAKQLNCPIDSVTWSIKLAKDRGLPIDQAQEGGRKDQVIIRLEKQCLFAFTKEAIRRGTTPADLAAKLITAVLTDNLFDAVLDEDAPESTSQKGASHVH